MDGKFHDNQVTSSFLLTKNTKKFPTIPPKTKKINKQTQNKTPNKPQTKNNKPTNKNPNQPTNQTKMKKASNKHLEINKRNLTKSNIQMHMQLDAVV